MRQGVTPIDQLMNLDDEEKTREETLSKYKTKIIRNTGDRGGMTSYEKYYNPQPSSSGVQPIQMEKVRSMAQSVDDLGEEDYRMYPRQYGGDNGNQNCIDVAHHTHNCPVCSRLYNTDKTIYMILIGLLIVICLILLKRVLEK